MSRDLVERIRQCPSLPTMPSVAVRILELTQSETADIAEIAKTISRDPALSSKILRTVNSSFYARNHRVSTISQALVILGLQSVKTLVLGFSLVGSLSGSAGKGFKHLTYWRHSVYSATAARTIVGRLKLVQQEECFLAALLMDIGMLVLDQVLGDEYGKIVQAAASHDRLAAAEQAALGLTHAQAAGLLAEQWKLPPVLAVPMAYHHAPAEVTDATLRTMAEVLGLASRCADVFVDDPAAEAIAEVRNTCRERHGMDEKAADALLDEIGKRTAEVAPLFEIGLASGAEYEAILKKANEALVNLTLQSQMEAAQLQQQNQQLQAAATRDSLTGLANRAHFESTLNAAFAAAQKQGRTMALLMLDLDRFKSVNDTHGHQAGDAVLKTVALLLKRAARKQDLAARYGGEEMALVMPDADRATAAKMAETIRLAISRLPVRMPDKTIHVTTSIGVAVLEPAVPFRDASQFLKAADLALYAAKHAGRNCVKVFSVKPAVASPAPPTQPAPAPTPVAV